MNLKRYLIVSFLLTLCLARVAAQTVVWRQATDAELASVLPSRAVVENEHIETEMRTSSGIVDTNGHFIAGVVLLTEGYSADGKYSHFLLVQAPVRVGGLLLNPGEYAMGWTRAGATEVLKVHINVAATGALVGTVEAHWIAGSTRVESLHIWPPSDREVIQIGRFALPYKLGRE